MNFSFGYGFIRLNKNGLGVLCLIDDKDQAWVARGRYFMINRC
jgi:hypothetical protein